MYSLPSAARLRRPSRSYHTPVLRRVSRASGSSAAPPQSLRWCAPTGATVPRQRARAHPRRGVAVGGDAKGVGGCTPTDAGVKMPFIFPIRTASLYTRQNAFDPLLLIMPLSTELLVSSSDHSNAEPLIHLPFPLDNMLLVSFRAVLPNTHYQHSHGAILTQTLYMGQYQRCCHQRPPYALDSRYSGSCVRKENCRL
jgi:hypothetical protein